MIPMPRPINLADCKRLEQRSGNLDLNSLFETPSPDLPGEILGFRDWTSLPISSQEAVQASISFVDEHLSGFGRMAPRLDSELDCPILYLPVSPPRALHVPINGHHYCILTQGFMNLLQFQSTAAIWIDFVTKMQCDLGVNPKDVAAYFNLVSLMFLADCGSLPPLVEEVAPIVQKKGSILAKVAAAFVFLHEVGHAKYSELDALAKREYQNSVSWQHSENPLTASKYEEIFADAFALSCFPEASRGLVIRAALLFFHLLNFLEVAGFRSSRSHPSAINRVFNLMQTCPQDDTSAESTLSAAREEYRLMKYFVRALREIRHGLSVHPESLFEEIHNFVLAKVDWRAAVETFNARIDSIDVDEVIA